MVAISLILLCDFHSNAPEASPSFTSEATLLPSIQQLLDVDEASIWTALLSFNTPLSTPLQLSKSKVQHDTQKSSTRSKVVFPSRQFKKLGNY